ncbi:hypothetical protein OXX79_005040 [Metschnikowia pulcherrima]
MGYTIKQKIEICLQSDANPSMTQMDLANWAMRKYNSANPPSQTTISRILSSKNDILGSKDSDFSLVRRRKVSNPLLRFVLTEWMTQAHWERIPVTTPIIQSTANAIWNKLPPKEKDGNGVFSQKWCNHFVRKLNVNLVGSPEAVKNNLGLPLNKVWGLDEKVGLKQYIRALIAKGNYTPKDLFTIDEFSLFYCVPLDQIFDVSSVDKGLNQTSNFSDFIITIMLGCNMDGSEKLNPLVVSKHDTFDLSKSTISTFHANPSYAQLSSHTLANKISEAYQITYKYNNNKWITSSTFQDYLLTLDHKLENVSPGRNIIIFLDDSSTHRLMNLEFKHVKLVYLENASKHNNPYNGLFNEVKFDYIPTSFGIIEEFKIVFRLQQYLEMINKQNNQTSTDHSSSPISRSESVTEKKSDCGEILSEKDYQVPFIRAIEWVKRSWDSISKQKIYQAWKKANIIDMTGPWPSSDPQVRADAAFTFRKLSESSEASDPHLAYNKLKSVMNYLNVVIPWEINELLGLVNERAKVSLNYASIDEMINSCASSEKNDVVVSEQATKVLDSGPEKEKAGSEVSEWTPMASNLLTDTNFEGSNSPTPQSDITMAKQFPVESAQQLRSFQNKLPPMAPASFARQIDTGNSRNSPRVFSLSENRSSSMNALLLATNASNHANLVSPPPASVMGSSNFNLPLLPRGVKREQESTHDDVPVNMGSSVSLDGSRKRSKLANNSTFGSPVQSPDIVGSPSFSQVTSGGEIYRFPYSLLNGRSALAPNSPVGIDSRVGQEEDLASVLQKVIEASNSNGLKLSDLAIEELKRNLSKIQGKENVSTWNGQEAPM